MKTSDSTDKIFPAFIKAQAEFSRATKDKSNPFFKSKYADLNGYLDGSLPQLQANGLAVLQDTSAPEEGNKISVSIRLIHTSGQWIESDKLTMTPTDMKPQTFGSCLTYLRRYNYSSFMSMGAEDDDGNRASKAPKAKPEAPKMD